MRLDVKFHQSDQRINVNFDSTIDKFSLGFGEVQQVTILEVEQYEGTYEATPRMETQTLATKDKYLRKDVQINAIPIIRVSNTSGGTTVYIASELYDEPDVPDVPDIPNEPDIIAVLGVAVLGELQLGSE